MRLGDLSPESEDWRLQSGKTVFEEIALKRSVICRRGSLERRSTAIDEPQAKTEQMYRCVRVLSESVPEVNTHGVNNDFHHRE